MEELRTLAEDKLSQMSSPWSLAQVSVVLLRLVPSQLKDSGHARPL